MGIIATGWKASLDANEALLAAFKMRIKKFNEAMHPRGADGRFISKGGAVKWIDKNSGLWNHGTVDKIVSTANDKAVLKVKRPNGAYTSVSSDQVYSTKAPVAKISMSDMKKVGPQAGSNPGGLYQDSSGEKYYIKTPQSEAHAVNEILGSRLYAATGVAVPEASITADKKRVSSRIEESIPWGDVSSEHKQAVYSDIRKNFVVDAWLANWDAPVTDNIRVNKSGVPLRVDTGGALDYRAQGGSKVANLTPEVKELHTLRDPSINPAGANLFGSVTKAEEEDGVKRILALHPDTIRDIVESEGGPERLAKDLIARRAWLATHYGFSLPETTADGKQIAETFSKTEAEDAVMPSLAPAVKKLAPNEPPTIAEGSPVWLKDKAAYGKGLPDVMIVTKAYAGVNENKFDLQAVKGGKTVPGVSEADLEALRENHASYKSKYSEGSVPSIGDKVALTTGATGQVVDLYPMYAKVKVDTPDGEKPVHKVVSTKKLTPQIEKIHAPNTAATTAADNDDDDDDATGLYSKPFKPEYAEIQQKYRSTAVAMIESNLAEDQNISTATLLPTQPKSTSSTAGTGAGPMGMKPSVAKVNDEYYLLDGHHRAMGKSPIDAHVVDFDKSKAIGSHDWSSNPTPDVEFYDEQTGFYESGVVEFFDADMPYVIVNGSDGDIKYIEKDKLTVKK